MKASNGYKEFHEHAGPISVITITCSLVVIASVWISTDWLSYPGLVTALAFFSLALFIITVRELRSRLKVMRAQDSTRMLEVIEAVCGQQPPRSARISGLSLESNPQR